MTQASLCSIFGYTRQSYHKQLKLRKEQAVQEQLVLDMVYTIRARQPRVGCRKMLREVNRRLLHLGEKPIGMDHMFFVLR